MRKAWRQPLVLSSLFSLSAGCLLFLYALSQYNSPWTSSKLSTAAVTIRSFGTGCNAVNNTAEPAASAQHSQLLQDLLHQVSHLNASIHATIKQTLDEHHESSARQQQQLQQQPPQQAKQERPLPVVQAKRAHEVHHTGMARAACDKRGSTGLVLAVTDKLVAPVVIVAHNRVNYLARCLMTILRYWSEDEANAEKFPLFVSVDGGHPETTLFASALNFGAKVQVIHNLRDEERCKPNEGYCNLSVHYQMLLQLFFECHRAPRLLFVEEDLEVAPDFFSYFNALAPMLDQDKSLWCVSAWNDHGQRGRAADSKALYRTDIMPGLGWMLPAAVGLELEPKWPRIYWDDWMREPDSRKGRQCIFPEVSRTHTFGKSGTSGGQFFDSLSSMLLNKDRINWARQDLSYLKEAAYAQTMSEWLRNAEPISADQLASFCHVSQDNDPNLKDLVVHYTDPKDFKRLAMLLPPMLSDTKGGRPRASYDGTVVVRCRGRRLFITPKH